MNYTYSSLISLLNRYLPWSLPLCQLRDNVQVVSIKMRGVNIDIDASGKDHLILYHKDKSTEYTPIEEGNGEQLVAAIGALVSE